MITEIHTRAWQQRIRWRPPREKYGCPECGHRSWQWPLQVLPQTYKTVPGLAHFVAMSSMASVMAGLVELKQASIEYGDIISIPRVDVLRYPPTE